MQKATLDDRIKSATATTAPSMVPEALVPPPPPETLPDMTVLVPFAQRLRVAQLIARHVELGEQASAIKKERDKLTAAIKPLMGQLKLAKATWGDYHLAYFNTPRTSFNQNKLLDFGIQPSVIAACTETKDSYTLRITRGGEDEEV